MKTKTAEKKSDPRAKAKTSGKSVERSKRGKALGDEELSRVAGGDIMIEQLQAQGFGKGKVRQ